MVCNGPIAEQKKERCPSRGIALMFNGPHSDVPCRKAPQVAYIVMFVTRWHRKSGGKDTFFPVSDGRPESAVQGAGTPCEKGGNYVLLLNSKKYEKIRIFK